MTQSSMDAPYDIELDQEGLLSAVRRRADGKEIPFDPKDPDYCSFLTWAANQEPAIAKTFERLEAGVTYLGREEDLIAYCREQGIVLYCVDRFNDGKLQPETGHEGAVTYTATGIHHSQGKARDGATNPDRFLFYRLYKATAGNDARTGNGVDGLYGARLPVFVSHTLHSRLVELLAQEDSDIRRISCCPVQKTFVYVDVSGFSQHPVGHQLLIINSLIEIANDPKWWSRETEYAEAMAEREANLCIGDGYIFVFRNAWAAVFFAGYLAALIESLIARRLIQEFHFRMSVHTGPVFRFWDRWGAKRNEGRWNYVGRGITDGERVLSAIGKDKDDVVYISAETRREILPLSYPYFVRQIPMQLQNRGRQADKHNVFRRLYELEHTSWMGERVEQWVSHIHNQIAEQS